MSEQASTLTPSEQAHIDSGGETPIVEESAPETAPEVEVVQPDEVETETKDPKSQKVVPLAALHEERAKAKEMKQRLAQLEQQTQLGNERLQQLYQAVQRQNQPPPPDKAVDPVAYFENETQTLKQQLAEQQQFRQNYEQTQRAQQEYSNLQNHVHSQINEYKAQAPDITDAIGHLVQADYQALLALGHDQATAQKMVTNHHDQLVIDLARQGVNIPERLHALAKARGYAPKAGAMDATQKIQAVQKGTAAAKSLGSGGSVSTGLSLQALAAMSPEEFSEATSGKNETAWRKLMGG